MEDRNKTLYKQKLCYGCLGNISKEHNAKSCTNRRVGKVCSRRHPTVLYGLKIQKPKKKRNNEDTDTKEDKPEEVKCASTNTGSDVISMCIVPVQIASTSTSKKVHNYALLDSCSKGTFIWTNWNMTLEYLEGRPHLQSKHQIGNLQIIQQQ